jgi:hypothetical protein
MSRDVEANLEPLLRQVVRQGWTLVCCGPRRQPDALIAVNRCQSWADVVILRGQDRAAAYRTLTRPQDDPLQTFEVVWHYLSDAQRTLRAVLHIPPYAVAPTPYPIPKECRIPEVRRRPLIIRLGSLGVAVDRKGIDPHAVVAW